VTVSEPFLHIKVLVLVRLYNFSLFVFICQALADKNTNRNYKIHLYPVTILNINKKGGQKYGIRYKSMGTEGSP